MPVDGTVQTDAGPTDVTTADRVDPGQAPVTAASEAETRAEALEEAPRVPIATPPDRFDFPCWVAASTI